MAYPLKQSNFEVESRTILSNFGYTILAPIVRIFMRFGYSARDFNDLARWVYVKVYYTSPDFWRFGRPTALQGAIKTGIPRSVVKQIHEIPEPQQILFTQRQNIAYRVIEGWVNDPEFHVDGKASVLPLHSRLEPSFRKLANKYGNDVTLGSVLGDLGDAGCIAVENGMVRLVNQTYGMNFLNEDLLMVGAYAAQRLVETVDYNLAQHDLSERRIQRLWWQVNVPEERSSEAMQYLKDALVKFGREVDARLAEFGDSKMQPGRKYSEIGFGVNAFMSDADDDSLSVREEQIKRSNAK